MCASFIKKFISGENFCLENTVEQHTYTIYI